MFKVACIFLQSLDRWLRFFLSPIFVDVYPENTELLLIWGEILGLILQDAVDRNVDNYKNWTTGSLSVQSTYLRFSC